MEGTRKVSLQKDNWHGLTEDEIRAIADWGDSASYKALFKYLHEVRNHHVAAVLMNPMTKDSLLELAERRGAYLEWERILKLPEKATKEVSKNIDNVQ